MANRIMLNQTSYHGAGAIQEIVNEAKAHGFKKAFVCSDPDLVKFNVTSKVTDLLKENGFTIVGTGATVSQHSIVTDVAARRPDEKDLEKLNEFVEKCREKLDSEEFEDIEVPGNKPYCEYKKVPLAPICDESLCTYCYECVSSCPEEAIPDMDPGQTDADLCSACTACIYTCPEDARYFTGDLFEGMKEIFLTNFNQRKESEFYL